MQIDTYYNEIDSIYNAFMRRLLARFNFKSRNTQQLLLLAFVLRVQILITTTPKAKTRRRDLQIRIKFNYSMLWGVAIAFIVYVHRRFGG